LRRRIRSWWVRWSRFNEWVWSCKFTEKLYCGQSTNAVIYIYRQKFFVPALYWERRLTCCCGGGRTGCGWNSSPSASSSEKLEARTEDANSVTRNCFWKRTRLFQNTILSHIHLRKKNLCRAIHKK
jgi:hypothetical protein